MIQPGLERISLLLKNIDFPWRAIHVAGTNGKGSVCAYAHALLVRRGKRCGRFTSPHLIDRWDCIHINNTPVERTKFLKVESHFKSLNTRENINASEFEILTACAFQLFNDHEIDIGVVEVGLGGKLDATNILQNQCVSVITKIAFDHTAFLGSFIEDIAAHKAGILRPGVPYIVYPNNEPAVKKVISDYARSISAGPELPFPAHRTELSTPEDQRAWNTFAAKYESFQLDNILLAYFAVKETMLQTDNLPSSLIRALPAFSSTQNPGRLQRTTVPTIFPNPARKILVDGAHNADSARELAHHVDRACRREAVRRGYALSPYPNGNKLYPVTWIFAMSAGKSALPLLSELLRDGDRVILTSFSAVDGMPWVHPIPPADLRSVIEREFPSVHVFEMPEGQRTAFDALSLAKYIAPDGPIVLAGSLYLVGDFYRQKRRFEGLGSREEEGDSEEVVEREAREMDGKAKGFFKDVLKEMRPRAYDERFDVERTEFEGRGERRSGSVGEGEAKGKMTFAQEIQALRSRMRELEEAGYEEL